jgi:hypothetical protein
MFGRTMQTRSWLIILLSITLFAACGKEAKIAQPAGAASAPTNDPSAEVVCSSMQDYESGLKYGMKTAPLCDIVKTDLKKCIGEYSKENWTNCLGERNMPDGSRYLGGYLDGKENGKGEFINKDGTRYIGYYLNGQRHGEGKEYSAAGIIEKTGKWVKGEYDSDVQINQEAERLRLIAVEAANVEKQEAERLRIIAEEAIKFKNQQAERLRWLDAENRKDPNYQDTSKMRRAFRTEGIANLRLNCHQGVMTHEPTGQKTNTGDQRKEGNVEIMINNGEGLMKMGYYNFQLVRSSFEIGFDADSYYFQIYPNEFFQYIGLVVSDNGIKLRQQAIDHHFDGKCIVK